MAAVIALLVYTLAFPIFMLVAIHKNKPRGSLEFPDKRYDEDGELVDYTDAMYRADLAAPDQKANPFNSLYKVGRQLFLPGHKRGDTPGADRGRSRT